MSTKVVTGKVRFSYANVWVPTSVEEGQEKKYNVSILIPKKDKETLAKITKAIDAEAEALKTANGGKLPKDWHYPLRDGDEEYPGDPIMEGQMFIRASSKNKPGIVDRDTDPILNQEEFYSGCYGRASVNAYFFGVNPPRPKKGVTFGLNNLQKLEDGDPLGGGRSRAEDDFSEAYEDDDLM